VERGSFLDEAVNDRFVRLKVPEAMKGLVYQIASGVIRQKGYLDWVIGKLVEKDVKEDVRQLLRISLYQIAFMKKAHYHVVMEAVEFAKREKGARIANFINAVLRRFIREREGMTYPEGPVLRLAVAHSFPEWLVRRWVRRFGAADTEKLVTLLNEPPQFTVRVNSEKISKEDVVSELTARGIGTSSGKFIDSALRVDKLGPVLSGRLFREGLITVQDEASQLTASAFEHMDGGLILDACAGSGTKAAQLRDLPSKPVVVAMDNDLGRLGLIRDKVNVVAADALKTPFRGNLFDAILVDAPCSSVGIIRKHPEIKWRRKKEDFARFGNYQLDLLRSLWDNLRQGGHMIYSVCSFEPEETVEVLEKFRKEKGAVVEKPFPFAAGEEYHLSLPHETGMDGFFIARLRKT